MEVKIIQEKISEKHNDSVWYDGDIASLKKKKGEDDFDCVMCDVAYDYDEGLELLKRYMEDDSF